MAKGSYNISVARDSNLQKDGKKNNESECMKSFLAPAFFKSWSFNDRRRSSRFQAEKQLLDSQYKAMLSSSLEKIPSNPSPASKTPESDPSPGFEPVGINAECMVPCQDASNQQTTQNLSDSWLEDSSCVESDKLLKKAITILRTLDTDIAESLTNLTRPESIAMESVMEAYRNKGKNTENCSAGANLNLSTKSCFDPIYENWQPPFQQSLATESCNEPIYENWQPPFQQKLTESSNEPIYENGQLHITKRPRDVLTCSTPQRLKTFQDCSDQQSSENLQAHSSLQSSTNLQNHTSLQSPTKLQMTFSQQILMNLFSRSPCQNPNNVQPHSAQQSSNSSVLSVQETFQNLSLESLNSGNSPSLIKPDSDKVQSVNLSPRNFSSPKISAPGDTSELKSRIEFNLPSDHEQFLKITGALQNRCLEYREMTRDLAISTLEECLNFSKLSIGRIRQLRKQFSSQKRNFTDFKKLCCKSVVFGPDSQPIDQKVTEVIQSFYLKLLQEENETFLVRLEFGLKMAEVYLKMLKLEMESKKTITNLEKEILYLKKTSVGFRV